MNQRAPRSVTRAARGAIAVALLVLVLAGCGGEDGGDGTATTVTGATATTSETSTIAVLTGTAPVESTTSAPEFGVSPGAGSPTAAIVVSAPPVVIPTPRPSEATPVSSSVAATPVVATASAIMGDGTGGPAPADLSPAGTPAATPTAAGLTVVTSCDVTDYPPSSGGSDSIQVTTVDVNLRAGPGTDCDQIGEIVSAGVSVLVLSEPVTREGDEFTWVAVLLDGEQGWLATAFLAPAAE